MIPSRHFTSLPVCGLNSVFRRHNVFPTTTEQATTFVVDTQSVIKQEATVEQIRQANERGLQEQVIVDLLSDESDGHGDDGDDESYVPGRGGACGANEPRRRSRMRQQLA